MEIAAVIVALVFALVVALAVFATVKAVRAVQRGVDRTVTQARRTVEDTRLKAKKYTQGGAAGEIADLRLSLRTSMRATQEVLRSGVAEDGSLSESLALFERLSAHGRELDEELRKLETEPDRERVAARLPEVRERTERVTHSANALRWAAQDRARRFAHDDLTELSEQIRMEAGALRHWEQEGEPSAEGRPAAGTGTGGTGAQDSVAEEAGARPALDKGPDPRWQTRHSWQQAKRPESTA
ncbi:hypothetical protein GCM10010218_15920 [Streptomyces mashuensis]|uniref:Secreted protein n=1 Tax=Streptomyces mashuensis TaxID=33904 RepID=A0A919B0K2_9ACTN|nr:hypothetical protein [Streptomyces mashuensis]GHF35464.1 hypothetical protein GCM10010218_15920 [Streptomyces mashuensis]